MNNIHEKTAASYDAIPYDSTPFAETHPDHLCVLGRLFGMPAPDPQQARILELGCATGGNIIPLAYYLPESHITGIELSAEQARLGGQLIEHLQLRNIRILQADIMSLDATLGEFDYIIVHGVYSWVPEAVREKILALCRELLSTQGIAYISYNTLPGWRMRGMLRDMLLYHARNAGTPRERLAKAHEFFAFMDQANTGLDALSSRYLREEIAAVRKAHPSYIYHEYMEEINQPFLFSDFMKDAARHDLQYLCDVELGTAFPSTISDAAEAALEAINDPVELEQMMDFVRNRNFRRSLLCRKECRLERQLDLERFSEFAFNAQLQCNRKPELNRLREQNFRSPDGHDYSVSHPLTKAALLLLAERHPDAVPFADLVAGAQDILATRGGHAFAAQTDHLFGELFSLYAHQAVRISPQAQHFERKISDRPQLHALALAQAQMRLGHLATVRHTTVQLDNFSAHLATLLDGSRSLDELEQTMQLAIADGHLAIAEDIPKKKRAEKQNLLRSNIERLLQIFHQQGLLTDTQT